MVKLLERKVAPMECQCFSIYNPFDGIDWRAFRAAYCVFLADPTTGIRHIITASQESRWQQWVMRRLSLQAESLWGRTIPVDLDALKQLPENTLGGAYARHMIRYGYAPETFYSEATANDWLDQRMSISHDLYHVITGFDASPLGEFGLAAFTLMQYFDLLNVFVLTFVPISLTNPLWTIPLVKSLVRGFRLGVLSKPAIAYPVELNWGKPLTQVRAELGIGHCF